MENLNLNPEVKIEKKENFKMSARRALEILDQKRNENNRLEIVVAREDLTSDETLRSSSEVITTLTQLIAELGYVNHHMRNYIDHETGESVKKIIIDTRDPNVFIERICKVPMDKKSVLKGNSELLITCGDKELIGTTPKSIDILAMQMRTEANRAVVNGRENGYIPELLKILVDGVSYVGIDIDGTLIDSENPNGLIDESAMKEFANLTLEMKREGITPFFFSGRGVADVKKMIGIVESFGGEISIAICENGAAIYDREINEWEIHKNIPEIAVLVKQGVENFLVDEVVGNDLGSLEEGKVVGISINPTEKGIQIAKEKVDIEEEIEKVKKEEGRIIQKEDFKPIDIYRIWIKNLLKDKQEDIIVFANAFKNKEMSEISDSDRKNMEQYLDGTISKIVNSATAVDINPCIVEDGVIKGVTKIEGIENFANKKGFTLENGKYKELAGIGDSGGDLFLKLAAVAAAVWNATGSLRYSKEINLNIISPYEVAKGTNDILKYILRIKKSNALANYDK